MNEIMTLHVDTVSHIPRSVRPLLAQILTVELRHACSDGLWRFSRFFLFAKAVLHLPHRGGRKKRLVIHSLLTSCLHHWQEGALTALWEEARCDANLTYHNFEHNPESLKRCNIHRALNLAKEGRYGLAMRSLGSLGCAASDDNEAFEELVGRHPTHNLPSLSDDIPPFLVVDSAAVLAALKAFPKVRVQELLDYGLSISLMLSLVPFLLMPALFGKSDKISI